MGAITIELRSADINLLRQAMQILAGLPGVSGQLSEMQIHQTLTVIDLDEAAIDALMRLDLPEGVECAVDLIGGEEDTPVAASGDGVEKGRAFAALDVLVDMWRGATPESQAEIRAGFDALWDLLWGPIDEAAGEFVDAAASAQERAAALAGGDDE